MLGLGEFAQNEKEMGGGGDRTKKRCGEEKREIQREREMHRTKKRWGGGHRTKKR